MSRLKHFSYTLTGHEDGGWIYYIHDTREKDFKDHLACFGKIVETVRVTDAEMDGPLDPPQKFRDVWERIIEYKPDDEPVSEVVNIVEMMTLDDNEGGGFNQLCAYGHLVEGHAVYCHNDGWLYSPRKCRRTWYTDGETRDEDCEGFKPNPLLSTRSGQE